MKKTINAMAAAALSTGAVRTLGMGDMDEMLIGNVPDLIIMDDIYDMKMVSYDDLNNMSNEQMELTIKTLNEGPDAAKSSLYQMPFHSMNMANFVHAFDQAERSTLPEFWGTKKNYKPSPDRQKVLDKRAKNKANRKRARR